MGRTTRPWQMSTNTDSGVAARVRSGERAALEQAFNSHGGAVKSMAMRVLREESLAEDVVQDVFVAFWRDPAKFDDSRGSLRTFLVTIAHRRAVDLVRAEEARFRREERVPQESEPSIDDEVWTRALGDTVRKALDELPDRERKAIAMAYFGGLSYVEVARRLGEPEGTIKSRIRAGMTKLSVSLAGVST